MGDFDVVQPCEAVERELTVDRHSQRVLCPVEGSFIALGRKVASVGREVGCVRLGCVVQQAEEAEEGGSGTRVGYSVTGSPHRHFAVKMWYKQRVADRAGAGLLADDPVRELAIMAGLRARGGHPHLLPLLAAYETDRKLIAVLPFCEGGDLFERAAAANDGRGFSLRYTRHFFAQLLSAVAHLHSIAIAHLDITLENILVTSAGGARDQLQLFDFGMARRCGAAGDPFGAPARTIAARPAAFAGTPLGKPYYITPEAWRNEPLDAPAQDQWACGINLAIMLTGAPLWKEASYGTDQAFTWVLDTGGSVGRLIEAWHPQVPETARSLLEALLAMEPAQRLSIDVARQHPFMQPGSQADTEPAGPPQPPT
eukprot:g7793.t1